MSPRLQDDLSFQLLLDSLGVTLVQRPVLVAGGVAAAALPRRTPAGEELGEGVLFVVQ